MRNNNDAISEGGEVPRWMIPNAEQGRDGRKELRASWFNLDVDGRRYCCVLCVDILLPFYDIDDINRSMLLRDGTRR